MWGGHDHIPSNSQEENGRDHGCLPSFLLEMVGGSSWPCFSTFHAERGRVHGFLLSFFLGEEWGVAMTKVFHFSWSEGQRPWPPSPTPPLPRRRMAETMATFPPSLWKCYEDDHDHTPSLLEIRRAKTMASFSPSF